MDRVQNFIDKTRDEIDSYYSMIEQFPKKEPGMILQDLAVISGRVSEIRTKITRIESSNRKLQQLRTKEIDPLLEEVDRQYKIWSRIISVRQQEFDMARSL